MPESYWFVHFLAFLRVISLSTVLSKSHFCSREKHFKSYSFVHLRVFSLSTFGVHFWPQKVDKLITLKVDKLITLWRLYVFPYLGLFGPFFWKTRTLIEQQTGTSVDILITFRNFQCCFSVFLVVSYFPVFFLFLVPFFDVFESSSKNLSYVSMLQTNKKDKETK